MVSENCCDHISPLARADGLRDFLGDQCHPYEHLVALMANNNDDYHWFRLDRDGKWSHKYGNKPAIKLLEGGKPIDPEVYASMKLYHFCGYFCVYKPSVRIKGPGCVYAGRSLKQDSVDVSTSSAEPGPIQVTLDLYSGRPNPTWSLSPPQVEELRRLIEQSNAERCDTATQPPYLGYAGFVISNPEGVTGLPYELRVYGGMLRATEQLGERALVEAGGEQWHGAQAHALEAWLMEQAKQLEYAEAIERMGGPRT
jgi:hypothetical protein